MTLVVLQESHRDQVLLLCQLLRESDATNPPVFMIHLSRAIANGAKFQATCDILVTFRNLMLINHK